jgi:hypothetical protein
MRWQLTWTAEASLPSTAEVLEQQGLPGEDRVPARIATLIHDARTAYVERAEPLALVSLVSRDRFAELYRGEGLNDPETPLERIYPRADALALFAATVGYRVVQTIRDLFARQDPARGYMLDAVASAAADGLATAVSAAVVERLQANGQLGDDVAALPYSPGYCGWHVSGQRKLFDRLHPEEIGIHLNDSFLMTPLKSVSGVLVAGPGEAHRFRPDYPFCEACTTHECGRRMASVLRH